MKNITKLLLASVIALFIGCDGDVGNNTTPTIVKTEATETVTAGTPTKVGDTGTTISVSEGTSFTDVDGNMLEKAPEAKVVVEKSVTVAKTVIDFTVDGKRVQPTSPVTVSVPAPQGVKVGEEVQIDAPIGSKEAKGNFILATVLKGFVVSIVIPEVAFLKPIIISVETKKDSSTN
jgi:hypothetical protein